MKHKCEDYKISAVKYYLKQDNNQVNTCKIFGCSRRSLKRWIDKYNQDKEIKRKNRKYIAYKVRKEYVNFLLEEVKKDKTIPIKDLLIKLNEKYKTDLSRYHISRIVRDNNITLKQTRLRHEPVVRYKNL